MNYKFSNAKYIPNPWTIKDLQAAFDKMWDKRIEWEEFYNDAFEHAVREAEKKCQQFSNLK